MTVRFKQLMVVAFILAVVVGCGKMRSSQPAESMVVPGGTVNPVLGLGFDVTYDPQLDDVVPGYKILLVAISNRSFNVVQLDEWGDRWTVVDRRGSRHEAVLNLRNENPNIWSTLPDKLKRIIQYPLMIQAGQTLTIDLIIKGSSNLAEFKSVDFDSSSMNKRIIILPREG